MKELKGEKYIIEKSLREIRKKEREIKELEDEMIEEVMEYVLGYMYISCKELEKKNLKGKEEDLERSKLGRNL